MFELSSRSFDHASYLIFSITVRLGSTRGSGIWPPPSVIGSLKKLRCVVAVKTLNVFTRCGKIKHSCLSRI